jgi:hypothetical protein
LFVSLAALAALRRGKAGTKEGSAGMTQLEIDAQRTREIGSRFGRDMFNDNEMRGQI